MRIGLGIASLACLAASPALADGAVDIDRSVYVERTSEGVRALEPATTLRPGDKVVLVVQWRSESRDRKFTVQSAVPRTLAFQRAGHDAAVFGIMGVPTAMIFIRNEHGSHNPDEAMDLTDFAQGLRLLVAAVEEIDAA